MGVRVRVKSVSVDFLLTNGERMLMNINLGHAKSLLGALIVSGSLAIASLGWAVAAPINVNTATQTEMESIKGIGPIKSKNHHC